MAKKLERISNRLRVSGFGDTRSMATHEAGSVVCEPFRNDTEIRLKEQSLAAQELLVTEDLLWVLLGVSGQYVMRDKQRSAVFMVDDSINASLLENIQPLLQLAACHDAADLFCRSTQRGAVVEAFAEQVEKLQQEYRRVLVLLEKRLEQGKLGLQQMCFHLQPYGRTLGALAALLRVVEERRLQGGALLQCLEDKLAACAGNKAIAVLVEGLVEAAFAAFASMLNEWLQTGTCHDPEGEFFASADGVREANVPRLLKGLEQDILRIGQHRRVLRDSGFAAETVCTVGRYDRHRTSRAIEAHVHEVNRRMLALVNRESILVTALCRAKHCFLVDRADMLEAFLDLAGEDLRKSPAEVPLALLQGHWELAVRNGPLSESAVTVAWTQLPLADHLLRIISGSDAGAGEGRSVRSIDVLTVKMAAEFPVSLVLTDKTLAKYELIFRLQLQLIDVSRVLAQMPTPVSTSLALLRRSMLAFVTGYRSYISQHVLSSRFERLLVAMENAAGLDGIVAAHEGFLDSCLRECLLTNAKLVQLVAMVVSTCYKFVHLAGGLDEGKTAVLGEHYSKYVRALLEALQYYAARDCDHYLGMLRGVLTRVLGNLMSRLDYNSFYYSSAFAQV